MPDVELMHAFYETTPAQQRAHIMTFFGHIPGDDEQYDPDIGSYVICYCGGRLTPITHNKDGDIMLGAVWHNKPRRENDDDF
jgi:hypothetical protein